MDVLRSSISDAYAYERSKNKKTIRRTPYVKVNCLPSFGEDGKVVKPVHIYCLRKSTVVHKNKKVRNCRTLLQGFKFCGLDIILICAEKWVFYENRRAGKRWLSAKDLEILTPKPKPPQKGFG